MFNTHHTHGVTQSVYAEGMILPVLSAEQLLGSSRSQLLFEQLKTYAQVPEPHFEVLYVRLIEGFAEFVQLLPKTRGGVLGGLLSQGIVRGITALQQFISHYGKSELDPLQAYAVFSAALCMDICKVVVNYKVLITDADGQYTTHWHPFAGAMTTLGTHYKLLAVSAAYQRLDVSVNVIFARQIMPESGFLWLSKNWRVFADWLDALVGGGRRGDRIAHTISRTRDEELDEFENFFDLDEFDIRQDVEHEEGEEFRRWLKRGIENGEIEVNTKDALVHLTSHDAMFVDKQIFKQYADMVKSGVNIHVVFTQFGNLLGIASKGGNDFLVAQYFTQGPAATVASGSMRFTKQFSQASSTAREGVAVAADVMLPSNKSYGVSTHLKLHNSATDLPQLPVQRSSRPGSSQR